MNMHTRLETPSNLDAENALLGAILMNNASYPVIAETGLEPEHFYSPLNQEIFRAMGKMIDAGKHANPVTLKSFITIEMQGDVTLAQYLAQLAGSAVSVLHVPDFAQAILIAWARRDMMGIAENLDVAARQAQEDFELGDSLQALKSRLEDCQLVIDGKQSEGMSFELAASTSLKSSMDIMSGATPSGVDFGIPALRQMISLAKPGDFILVSGMTKHGKSSAAQQMARGAADSGHPAFYYSGEMRAGTISQREMARETGISTQEQNEARMSASDLERLAMASRTVSKLPITVFDRRMRLSQLARKYKGFVSKARSKGLPIPVLVVDAMLHVERDNAQMRMGDTEYASFLSDRLKALAEETDSVVIGLAQLKKNTVERPNPRYKIDAKTYRLYATRRPQSSDIYGSCEKDADHVIIVWNPEVVLMAIAPPEEAEERIAWEEVFKDYEGKAEILLALSRSAKWPTLRRVNWNGKRHHFSFPNDEQSRLL